MFAPGLMKEADAFSFPEFVRILNLPIFIPKLGPIGFGIEKALCKIDEGLPLFGRVINAELIRKFFFRILSPCGENK